MNFHVLILVDGKLPLDFDHQIRTLVDSIFGISAFVAQATENSYDEWRF